MADGTTLDPGAGGDKIATDDLGAVGKAQWVKLMDGTDGGTAVIPGDATNGLDVDVTRVQGAVAVTDNSGSLTVDDGGSTLSVDDGAGSLTVDATSLPLPTGASTAAKQPALGTAGTASSDVISVQGVASMTPVKTDGSGVTQPVSAAALPLPSGAATSAKQPALGTAGTPSADVLSVQGAASMTALKTDASATTQPVSAASLPLPSGASTAAKQPALGTAGAASADVLSVQGVASMTALKVDGSGVTQPVSGTVTANAGTGTLSTNHAQVAGTTTDTNSGVKSAGTQRMVIATDQPQLTNALKVDPSAVTSPVSIAAAVAVTDNSGSLTVDAPLATPVFVTATPSATGGWSKVKYAAQTTTVQTPKGTAATFGGYYVYNPNASVAYVQVFDAATATTITLGSTAPDMIFGIPAASAANLELTNGVNMTNGVKLACTTTATGSTAPTTGLDMTVFYK